MIKINKLIIVSLTILIFSINASATTIYTDIFNSGISGTNWLISGSWVNPCCSGFDNSNFAFTSDTSSPILTTKNGLAFSTLNQWSVDFNFSGGASGGNIVYGIITLKANSSSGTTKTYDGRSIRFKITQNSGSHPILSGEGFTYISQDLVANGWYKIIATEKSGNILDVKLYNSSLLNEQNTTNEIIINNADRMYFTSDANTGGQVRTFGIDNIILTSAPITSGNSILWNTLNPVVDDDGSYIWSIPDSDYNAIFNLIPYNFRADIYYNNVLDKSVSLSSQTGTNFYAFKNVGTYEVKLIKNFAILGFSVSGDTELANDSILVRSIGDSYINLPQSVDSGIPVNVNFSFGFTPTDWTTSQIKEYFYDGTTFILETTYDLNSQSCSGQCQAGHLYTIPIIFQNDGLYRVDLIGTHNGGLVIADSKQTTAIFSEITPTFNLTNSYINTTKSIYFIGEFADVSYGIDSTNYSQFKTYLELYNWDLNTLTNTVFLSKQTDTKNFYFTLNKHFIVDMQVISGNNDWILASYYANGTRYRTITHKNITISNVNSNGFGMVLDKTSACIDETVLSKIIMPSDATNVYLIIDEGVNTISNLKINSSINYPLSFSNTGIFNIILWHDGNTEAISKITINNCQSAQTQTQKNAENNSLAIAFLITAIVTGWVAYFCGKHGSNPVIPAILVFMLSVGVFTKFGMIPLWITMTIVLTLIVAVAYKFSDIIRTGGG